MNFTIPLPPITKKNSQRIICRFFEGKYDGILRDLEAQMNEAAENMEYEKAAAWFIPRIGPISKPVNVKAIFYMPTRRRVDLVNLEEALLDILVKYELLEDDNCTVVKSMDGSRVEYDKNNPRTEVEINDAM